MALKTATIGNYTVSQMGPLQAARLRLHLKNLDALALGEDVDDLTRYNYALLAACVEPVITWGEYVEMPMAEIGPLAAAVEQLNADMVTPTDDTPQAKKKRH